MKPIYTGYLSPEPNHGDPDMLPEDDYLRLKPAAKEHQAVLRIALMALMGCLALMAVLVVQATAATSAPTSAYGSTVPKPSVGMVGETPPASTAPPPGLTIFTPAERSR